MMWFAALKGHEVSWIKHMVQTFLNKLFQEVDTMNTPDQTTYKRKNITVKVERIFTGGKTSKELVLELLKKRRDGGGLGT